MEKRFRGPTVAALPSPPKPRHTLWEHNGSIVHLEVNQDQRRFFYDKPRPGMAKVGVKPGTLLFDGQSHANAYTGTTYIFNPRCGRVPYRVSGPILDDGRRVVVRGNAPHVDGNCRVSRYAPDTLEFKLLPGQ